MQINSQRLMDDLRRLAAFGQFEIGVDRTAFSTQDIAARHWLAERMRAAGLDAVMDGVGNVYGRMPGPGRAILIGSHTDTVPAGGWLDGSLGVIYGLELARCVLESGRNRSAGVDVVSFQDEEGTFLPLLGSRSFCGEDIKAEMAEAKRRDGKALGGAIKEADLAGLAHARLDAGRHVAYLEAHIEQGPRLENEGITVGIVSAIAGTRSFRIIIHGRADHAGTTPMSMRSDAGAAATLFAVRIAERFAARAGPGTVWNLGACTLLPGADNVVPSAAQLLYQFRDTAPDRLAAMDAELRACANETAAACRVSVEITDTQNTLPTAMDARWMMRLGEAAGACGVRCMEMPSGAGHDAVVLARHVPSAMLFVPSIGGRSHHVSENTAEHDIVAGAQVLAAAVTTWLDEQG